jgi:hypothetical protein
VNWFTRRLGLAFVASGILGIAGCTDNETEADKLQKPSGNPGAPLAKAEPTDATQPGPTTQEEWFKQRGGNTAKVGSSSAPKK